MSEFVGERKVDAPLRTDPAVVENTPTWLALRGPEQGPVEPWQIGADDARNSVSGVFLTCILLGDRGHIDRKTIAAQHGVEDMSDLKGPALRRKRSAHSSSPHRSTIRRIFSFVSSGIFRYFR